MFLLNCITSRRFTPKSEGNASCSAGILTLFLNWMIVSPESHSICSALASDSATKTPLTGLPAPVLAVYLNSIATPPTGLYYVTSYQMSIVLQQYFSPLSIEESRELEAIIG